MNKAVFLDRDGVINNEEGLYYIFRPEDFTFNPGIKKVLRALGQKGYRLIVVTNQGGVSRGLYTLEDVAVLHDFMRGELERDGIMLDEIYVCPHHPDVENCLCRKPQTLWFEKAISRFNIDPRASWFIGDRETDMEAGRNAGLRTIMVEPNSNIAHILDIID